LSERDPARRHARSDRTVLQAPLRSLDPARSVRRVLIVEDDSALQDAFSTLLESEGYAAEVCKDGKAALDALGSGARADVILLDLHLPVMDGWQFRAAQRRDPSIAHIPVVAISGDESAQAVAVHAEAYLRKPILPRELISVIERVVAEEDRRQLSMRLVESERLAAIGRVAAGVGHEINNPLAYITLNMRTLYERVLWTGAAQRWWDAEDLEDLPEMLGEVLEGLDRIGRIVENLRTLSRREAHTLLPLNVESILDRALATLDHQIVRLARVECAFGEVPVFGGDPDKLMQLFLNLITNAVHAMQECHRDAHVLRIETSLENDEVHVAISDTGSGIRREILPRIFDPFFTTKPRGTGLGLAICRQLVQDHGGGIEVVSAPGSGSTVHVRLPLVEAPGMESSTKATPRRSMTRRGRVLVVDDERFIRKSIARSLAPQHDVLGVESVARAIEVLSRADKFDLILCDVRLAHGSGIELYEFLRAETPERLGTLVFMTGGVLTSQAGEAIERSKLRVVLKPLRVEELRSLAADAVEAGESTPKIEE
jgi:signal transduction histidine kinase